MVGFPKSGHIYYFYTVLLLPFATQLIRLIMHLWAELSNWKNIQGALSALQKY